MSFVLSVGVIYPINQLDKRVRYIQFKYSMTGGQVSQKDDNRYVNIFHKHNYCIIHYVSTYYKTYCFTFQKRLFCNVKAQVLPSKTAAFAMPKRSYQFLTELSLQNYPPHFVSRVITQRVRLSFRLTPKSWVVVGQLLEESNGVFI